MYTWLSETHCCLQYKCLETCPPCDCPNSLSFWLLASILWTGDMPGSFSSLLKSMRVISSLGSLRIKSLRTSLRRFCVNTRLRSESFKSHVYCEKLVNIFYLTGPFVFLPVTHEGQEFTVSVPTPGLLSSFHCDESDLPTVVCGGGCHSWFPAGPSAKHLLCCPTISCIVFGEAHALCFWFSVCFIFYSLFFETQSHGTHAATRLTM